MSGRRASALVATSVAAMSLAVALLVAAVPAPARAAGPLGIPGAAGGAELEYRVERIAFTALEEGEAERELERVLNRRAREGWMLDQVLEWSSSSALVVLVRRAP